MLTELQRRSQEGESVMFDTKHNTNMIQYIHIAGHQAPSGIGFNY